MQKPLQEYIRGMYGGYLSEATRKTGGDSMDLQSFPISANPLDLALKLSKSEGMLPKPLSALPDYIDPTALEAIRASLNVPLMGGGMGAEIVTPPEGLGNVPEYSLPPETGENQYMREEPASPETVGTPRRETAPAKYSLNNVRNMWTQINALGMNIPDAKRRYAFIASEIERMKEDGEIDEKSAKTLHNWNNSINMPQEEKRFDDRLLWLLMIASLFQR